MTRRRRLRLRVVTLAVVCALVVTGWLAPLATRAILQHRAVTALRALGAVVTYDYQLDPAFRSAASHEELLRICGSTINRRGMPDPDHDGLAWLRRLVGPDLFQDVVSVHLVGSFDSSGSNFRNPTREFDEAILLVRHFPQLRVLRLIGNQACDRVLDAIKELRRLEYLVMWDAAVTDRGIANLRGLENLRAVDVTNAGLGDASLEVLGGRLKLERLSLRGNCFTDEGLRHLGRLTELRELSIGNVAEYGSVQGCTRVRGEGLSHLTALHKLVFLEMQNCGLSDAGIPHLRALSLEILFAASHDLSPEGVEELGPVPRVAASPSTEGAPSP